MTRAFRRTRSKDDSACWLATMFPPRRIMSYQTGINPLFSPRGEAKWVRGSVENPPVFIPLGEPRAHGHSVENPGVLIPLGGP